MDFLPATALRPLELLLNRGIGQSTTAEAIAAVLDGKCLDVRIDAMPLALRMTASDGQVRLGMADETPATAAVAGPLLAMLRLLGGDPQGLIRAGDIRISGDTEVADQFRDLLGMARPDIEDELSKLVGDTVAHQLGNLARGFADWGARAADSVARSVGEYLTEERRSLPTRPEVDEFCAAVDTLASDVDRAEARLARLQGQARDR